MKVYTPVFVECAEELSNLCDEGGESLGGRLVFVFVFSFLLVDVVVVGGKKGCFIGGDNVEGFTW